jgi:hypothetical protein
VISVQSLRQRLENELQAAASKNGLGSRSYVFVERLDRRTRPLAHARRKRAAMAAV